jgi:WD40 repeat protein
VWRYDGQNVQLRATLCGHEGGKVTCVDVSTTFGTIVTGGADGNVLVWDLRTLTFLRKLRHTNVTAASEDLGSSAISVSVNHKNGNILTLVGSTLSLFDINGNQVATLEQDFEFESHNRPSCAIATDCPEWMENGIVAVTGHVNGDVRLWGLDYESKVLVPRHQLPDKVHSCPITALRVSGDRQDTLLVGDKSGKMSVCKTLQLEALNQQELALVLHELRTIKSSGGYRNVMPDKERAIMAEGAY